MNTLISQNEQTLTISGLSEELIPFAEYANQHLSDGYQIIVSGNTTEDPQYVTLTIPVNYPKYYHPVIVLGNTYMLLNKHPAVMIVKNTSPAYTEPYYTLQIGDLQITYYMNNQNSSTIEK